MPLQLRQLLACIYGQRSCDDCTGRRVSSDVAERPPAADGLLPAGAGAAPAGANAVQLLPRAIIA
jgi:hypothetical protein